MQIRGDYTGLSPGSEYQDPGFKRRRMEPSAGEKKTKEHPGVLYERTIKEQKKPVPEEKALEKVKSFWNSLGEQEAQPQETPEKGSFFKKSAYLIRLTEMYASLIEKVQGGVEIVVSHLPDRIRKILPLKLDGFKKEQESFTAFTDGQGMEEAEQQKKEEQKKEQIHQMADPRMTGKALHSSHLMDSYDRSGAYSRLLENTGMDSSIDKKG